MPLLYSCCRATHSCSSAQKLCPFLMLFALLPNVMGLVTGPLPVSPDSHVVEAGVKRLAAFSNLLRLGLGPGLGLRHLLA
ncbi:hypothetical protein QBC39DRAFT_364175 [Podospora conica]|nr:hypothetical protein QBC39DRAFT_364175 [Schizothecium conicum]